MRPGACALAAATAIWLALFAVPAGAASFAVGVEAGATRPDPQFEKYDWVHPVQPGLGVFVAVEGPRLSLALRGYGTENRQQTASPATRIDTRVRWYAMELVPRLRVLAAHGFGFWAGVGVGRMRVEYSPDRLTVEIPGTGESTEAYFAPIDDWTASVGGALRVDALPRWSFALGLDHHWYRLDTMQRDGDTVIAKREGLSQWDLRMSIACRFGT